MNYFDALTRQSLVRTIQWHVWSWVPKYSTSI